MTSVDQKTPPDGFPSRRALRPTLVGSGFPHSEIVGSKLVRSSPTLIAAYHVLHRLSAPRHPPNALKSLDRSHCQCPPQRDSHQQERPLASRDPPPRNSTRPCTRTRQSRELPDHPVPAGRISLFTMSNNTQGHTLHRAARKTCLFLGSCRSRHQTPALQSRLTPNPCTPGGARRDRTDDLMLAKHALSQLSYGPKGSAQDQASEAKPRKAEWPPRRVAREA